MEPLNDMALFVEVVKAMSFRRAAEAIGMPSSTLSRRISALEKAIGLRLLHRTTRKIELTEAGQIYYERCRRIVDEARLAHEQLGEMLAQPIGVLRASLPVDFAYIYLTPLLTEFAQRYPGITFEFDLTPRKVDLVTEPFDVAIRMGEQQNSNLIARQLSRLPQGLYASPRYLGAKAGTWTLHNDAETVEVEVSGRFRLNSIGLIQRLAIQGMGVAVLAEDLVADELANERLHRVLPQWQAPPVPIYAITETRLLPAKTQRFIEFLREHLRQV